MSDKTAETIETMRSIERRIEGDVHDYKSLKAVALSLVEEVIHLNEMLEESDNGGTNESVDI